MTWLLLLLLSATMAAAISVWRRAPTRNVAAAVPPSSTALSTTTRRRALWIAATLVVVAAGQVVVLVVVAVISRCWAVYRKRCQARTRVRVISTELAETIDLFAVALSSGHNLVTATEQVAQWSPGEFGEHIRGCLRQAEQGRSLADVFDELPSHLGDEVRPLTVALAAHERFGAPVSATLTRLAEDVRLARRRNAEISARQLPVVMLFPLVACVLPAFVLLTVVPVIADSLSSFHLFASP